MCLTCTVYSNALQIELPVSFPFLFSVVFHPARSAFRVNNGRAVMGVTEWPGDAEANGTCMLIAWPLLC